MLIGKERNYINFSKINFTHQTHNSTKTSFNKIVYECAQLINQGTIRVLTMVGVQSDC
jgi:hypothetical protein